MGPPRGAGPGGPAAVSQGDEGFTPRRRATALIVAHSGPLRRALPCLREPLRLELLNAHVLVPLDAPAACAAARFFNAVDRYETGAVTGSDVLAFVSDASGTDVGESSVLLDALLVGGWVGCACEVCAQFACACVSSLLPGGARDRGARALGRRGVSSVGVRDVRADAAAPRGRRV